MSPVFVFGSSLSLDWAQAQLKSTWLSRPTHVLVRHPTSFTWKDANSGATLATYMAPHQLPLGHPRRETKWHPHAFHMPWVTLEGRNTIPLFPLPYHALFHQKRSLKILEGTKPQSKPPPKLSSQSDLARKEGQRTHSPLQALNHATPIELSLGWP